MSISTQAWLDRAERLPWKMPEESRASTPASFSSEGQPHSHQPSPRPEERSCRYFRTGFCGYGDSCTFVHVRSPYAPVPSEIRVRTRVAVGAPGGPAEPGVEATATARTGSDVVVEQILRVLPLGRFVLASQLGNMFRQAYGRSLEFALRGRKLIELLQAHPRLFFLNESKPGRLEVHRGTTAPATLPPHADAAQPASIARAFAPSRVVKTPTNAAREKLAAGAHSAAGAAAAASSAPKASLRRDDSATVHPRIHDAFLIQTVTSCLPLDGSSSVPATRLGMQLSKRLGMKFDAYMAKPHMLRPFLQANPTHFKLSQPTPHAWHVARVPPGNSRDAGPVVPEPVRVSLSAPIAAYHATAPTSAPIKRPLTMRELAREVEMVLSHPSSSRGIGVAHFSVHFHGVTGRPLESLVAPGFNLAQFFQMMAEFGSLELRGDTVALAADVCERLALARADNPVTVPFTRESAASYLTLA
jgi:hypothetical protein